jgi:hypothetical protein
MARDLVKSSKAVKGSTSIVRTHLDAVEKAREIYLAAIKRAESDYFERIKRATQAVIGEQEIDDAQEPIQKSDAQQGLQLANTGTRGG